MSKTAVTEFGKLLRKHRVDRGEPLYEMAKAAQVSSSFLSAVETGQKRAPKGLVDRLVMVLNLDLVDAAKLRQAAEQTGSEIRIPLQGRDMKAREVAAMFARKFESTDMDALRAALEQLDLKKETMK